MTITFSGRDENENEQSQLWLKSRDDEDSVVIEETNHVVLPVIGK